VGAPACRQVSLAFCMMAGCCHAAAQLTALQVREFFSQVRFILIDKTPAQPHSIDGAKKAIKTETTTKFLFK